MVKLQDFIVLLLFDFSYSSVGGGRAYVFLCFQLYAKVSFSVPIWG